MLIWSRLRLTGYRFKLSRVLLTIEGIALLGDV